MKKINRYIIGTPLPDYPIKILQFGGGRFQRGFTNWIIQQLNETTDFNANVVVVKPTKEGDYQLLRQQEGLFHVLLSHSQNGQSVRNLTLVSNIARIIHPYQAWSAFLETARIPSIRFIISNTTESGLTIDPSKYLDPQICPHTYPAKLTIWLYERFTFYQGDVTKGCYLLPLELVANNGNILHERIINCAERLGFGPDFLKWLRRANYFCTSLVDRIVSGYPELVADEVFEKIGVEDQLLVQGEQYHSWIIEGPEQIKKELPIDTSKLAIQIVPDITPFYKIKVRILNGMHTSLVGIGLLSGFQFVYDAISQKRIAAFLERMVMKEVIPCIKYDRSILIAYFKDTLNRFSNEEMRHPLESIALNSASKFTVRLYATLKEYYQLNNEVPQQVSFVLACIILLYKREAEIKNFELNDRADKKELFQKIWRESNDRKVVVDRILGNSAIWDANLNEIRGLSEVVADHLIKIEKVGALKAMDSSLLN